MFSRLRFDCCSIARFAAVADLEDWFGVWRRVERWGCERRTEARLERCAPWSRCCACQSLLVELELELELELSMSNARKRHASVA
jgi:hypothetical protein